MSDKFVTWKDNLHGKTNYDIRILKKIEITKDSIFFEFKDSAWVFGVKKKYFKGKYPKEDDVVEVYGMSSVEGLCINGKTIFFKGVLEIEEERKAYLANSERETIEAYKKNKPKLDKYFSELPEIFQKRIQVFRDNCKKDFRANFEDYEIGACREAVNIAKHYPTEEKLDKFIKADNDPKGKTNYKPLSDGHSGNTWGFSKRLAWWYVTNSENVYKEHGAMTPLTGCEEYGCIHPR